MKKLKFKHVFLIALSGVSFLTACSSDDHKYTIPITESKTAILSAHVWQTTAVFDQHHTALDLATLPASNYVGYAYYKQDGTFRIVDLNDQPKMFGLWKLTDGETKRHLTVFNKDNTVAYTREVDLLTLDHHTFTYRIVPDPTILTTFYDVVHQPVTNHPEPATPAEILAATNWTTTKVWDITQGVENAVEMDKTQAPAANFSGDAYYINTHGKAYFPQNKEGKYANGTFLITAYNDKDNVRSQGDWYVSVDGTQRTLLARNADHTIAWERTVPIVELSSTTFTYDIVVGEQTLRVEHKPIQN